MNDFSVSNHGTVCLLHGHTTAAADWIESNLPGDVQRFGLASVVVEPRYLEAILDGIVNDGLEVA
jgi:hypothetical protein